MSEQVAGACGLYGPGQKSLNGVNLFNLAKPFFDQIGHTRWPLVGGPLVAGLLAEGFITNDSALEITHFGLEARVRHHHSAKGQRMVNHIIDGGEELHCSASL
jgi:hypothetical protein